MKKTLIPLLLTTMFANAEVVTSVGEYNYGPDTSDETACIMAQNIARQNAILQVSGEDVSVVTIENCKNEKCDIQKDFISDQQGYIKSIIEESSQTKKALGYKKCTTVIRADVEKVKNPIQFRLHQKEFNFHEGDEVIISGSSNKQGLVMAFLYVDGVYHLIDGLLIASTPGKFMLPSTRENKLIAYLPENRLQSKELLTVLFIESDDRHYDIKSRYNKIEMEDFIKTIPVQKRKVVNEFVYIMKRGNTL